MTFDTSISNLKQPRQTDAVTETIYVRNAGSDDNAGDLANPLLTVQEAFNRLKRRPGSALRQIIDLTGFTNVMTESIYDEALSVGPKYEQWIGRAGGLDNGRLDDFDYPLEVRADPTLVRGITINSSASNPTTGQKTFTVDETLVVDVHVGQWISDVSQPQYVTRIDSNTANTITVLDSKTLGGACNIYTEGGAMNFATADMGFELNAECPVVVSGLKFTGWASFSSNENIYALCCAFDEGLYLHNTAGRLQVISCTVSSWIQQIRASVSIRGTRFVDVGFMYLCFGLLADLNKCIFDNCTPVGAIQANANTEITQCIVRNGVGNGIEKDGEAQFLIRDTVVENCAGDAIHVTVGGGRVTVNNVTGSGNTGVGLRLEHGAQCFVTGTVPTVTGTGGDLKVGDSVVGAWTDSRPATDVGETNPHFCRIF